MIERNTVIIVPGVGNTDPGFRQYLARLNNEWPLNVTGFNAFWTEGEENFEDKLTHLVEVAKVYKQRSSKLFLMGLSASGSLVVAATHELGDDVAAAVTVCARLRDGCNDDNEYPDQSEVLQRYPAHRRAVQTLGFKVLPQMTADERHKVLTIQPWRDEIVPIETMDLPGANNMTIRSYGHGATLYSGHTSSLALGFMLGKS